MPIFIYSTVRARAVVSSDQPTKRAHARRVVFCCLRWLAKHSRRSAARVSRTTTLVRAHATELTTVRIHPTHQPGLGADVASLSHHTQSSPSFGHPASSRYRVHNTTEQTQQEQRVCIHNICRPQIMCDYPLNLSILIRGGKETNKDSPSSCERKGKSSARRGGALARLPGSVYWKFCHLPCPAQCPSSTRMWLLLPQRVIGP